MEGICTELYQEKGINGLPFETGKGIYGDEGSKS